MCLPGTAQPAPGARRRAQVAKLRAYHYTAQTRPEKKHMSRFGLDLVGGAVRNNVDAGVLEPVLAKIKIIQARDANPANLAGRLAGVLPGPASACARAGQSVGCALVRALLVSWRRRHRRCLAQPSERRLAVQPGTHNTGTHCWPATAAERTIQVHALWMRGSACRVFTCTARCVPPRKKARCGKGRCVPMEDDFCSQHGVYCILLVQVP